MLQAGHPVPMDPNNIVIRGEAIVAFGQHHPSLLAVADADVLPCFTLSSGGSGYMEQENLPPLTNFCGKF
jgi:hypothetical protein